MVSPSDANRRERMPVRSWIHSSVVSTSDSKNELGTTRAGRDEPTPEMRA